MNISFQAQLKVSENLKNNMPKGTPDGYIENLEQKFKKFLNRPEIDLLTEGDTVELKRRDEHYKFGIDMDITNSQTGEIMSIPFRQSKPEPRITANGLALQFCNYLACKYDSNVYIRNYEKLIRDCLIKFHTNS